MNFPPTLKQLRYLVTLQKTMHFGKAAAACHVTQSTLSAGIQELEALLGLKLVERTKRTVLFSSEGEEIVRRAISILRDVDDLTDYAATARNPRGGQIRMGVIPTIAPFLLPRIMPALRTALPELELHIREDKSADLCERLKAGDIDLILYALPFACGDVAEYPLFEDPFVAAYPQGQAPHNVITREDLSDGKLMLLEEGHCLRDHALDACQLVATNVESSLAGTSLHTIIEMVASGYGITLLPQMAIDAGLVDQKDIDLVPLAEPTPSRTIGLVWRGTHPRSQIFEKIGEVIKSAVSI